MKYPSLNYALSECALMLWLMLLCTAIPSIGEYEPLATWQIALVYVFPAFTFMVAHTGHRRGFEDGRAEGVDVGIARGRAMERAELREAGRNKLRGYEGARHVLHLSPEEVAVMFDGPLDHAHPLPRYIPATDHVAWHSRPEQTPKTLGGESRYCGGKP